MGFLDHFFIELNSLNIDYCVLRNYEGLPTSTNGSDLDILINKNQLIVFHQVLSNTLSQYGGRIVSFINSSICPKYCILWSNTERGGLMIDLYFDDISYRHHIIIRNVFIKSNTFSYNGILVLNKQTDKIITFLKELLNNGTCSEKQYNRFIEESLTKEYLDSIFNPLGKSGTVKALMECNIGKYCDNEITRIMKELDKDFPVKWYSPLLKISKISRLLQKPGYTIAFLGTDGSGKSTLINQITSVLEQAFHNSVYYKHLRPEYLPPLAHFYGKNEEQVGPVTNPHANPPSGLVSSLIRWTYYLIDYVLGYFIKISPKKSTKACAFIFDRYYYDYYIDKRRSRINLPDWIIRLGQLIIPEPDIILCLGTDPVIIHNRKPELPVLEVERQIEALKNFCHKNRRAVWIDTGQTIEDSSKDALNAIIDMMAKRFEHIKLSDTGT